MAYARYRYRPSGRMSRRELAVMVAIGLSLAVASGRASTHAAPHPPVADAAAAPSPVAAQAIAYARRQLGKPYVWGGTGPYGFDCSGLVYAAYRSAGVILPRTTEAEWAGLRHITRAQLQPGDLIEYAGSDGTVSDPGHVVMYLGGGMVIQAYATGYPVMLTPLADVQAGGLTGYVRP